MPGSDRAVTVPPMAATASATMVRPMPVPSTVWARRGLDPVEALEDLGDVRARPCRGRCR